MPIGIHRRGYQIIYAGIAPPPAPANLAITGASGGVVGTRTPTVTFTAAPGATSHKLQWSTDSGFSTVTGETTIAMPTAEYTHTVALLNFTDYWWRLAAIGPGGQGPWSDSVTVQTEVTDFYDSFPTDYAAPAPDPLNSKWDIYDTAGTKLRVSSGAAGWDSSTGTHNPAMVTNSNKKSILPFPAGALALRFRSGGGRAQVGIGGTTNAGAGSGIPLFPHFDLNAGVFSINGRLSPSICPTFAQDETWYWIVIWLRDDGASLYIKGGAHADWRLVFTVEDQTLISASATLAPFMTAISTTSNFDFDDPIIATLPSPLSTDHGSATAYQATSTANDVIAMTANALVEWILTAATGVTQKLYIRRTDDDNTLYVECDQSAGKMRLIKREGGSNLTLQEVNQTWTNGTAYRVTAICNGNTIQVQAASGSEWSTLSATPISQSNSYNASATGVKVTNNGGVLASWPLVDATVSAVLDKMIAVAS